MEDSDPNSSARSRSHWPAADEKNSRDFVLRRARALLRRRSSCPAPAVASDLGPDQLPQPPRRRIELGELQRVKPARAIAPRLHPAFVGERLEMPADRRLRQLQHRAELRDRELVTLEQRQHAAAHGIGQARPCVSRSEAERAHLVSIRISGFNGRSSARASQVAQAGLGLGWLWALGSGLVADHLQVHDDRRINHRRPEALASGPVSVAEAERPALKLRACASGTHVDHASASRGQVAHEKSGLSCCAHHRRRLRRHGVGVQRPLALPNGTYVDLSHPYDAQTVYWPTSDPFKLEKLADGMTPQGYYYAANRFSTSEHGGTHIDAPMHFAQGKHTVDAIPLEQLVGSADRRRCDGAGDAADPTTGSPRQTSRAGNGPTGAFQTTASCCCAPVSAATGRMRERTWARRSAGPTPLRSCTFPGLHPDAAKWLVDNRRIKAIGLDTASIDYRPVDALREPPHPDGARHPGVREPDQPGSIAGDWQSGDCAADEDRRRQRRAAAGHCDRAEVIRSGSAFEADSRSATYVVFFRAWEAVAGACAARVRGLQPVSRAGPAVFAVLPGPDASASARSTASIGSAGGAAASARSLFD